jgi:hypothetical protein
MGGIRANVCVAGTDATDAVKRKQREQNVQHKVNYFSSVVVGR